MTVHRIRFVTRVLGVALFAVAAVQAPANAAQPDPVPEEGLIVQESTGGLMTPDDQAADKDQYVQIWRRDPGNDYYGSQYWDFQRLRNGAYTIRNTAINRCLQTRHGNTAVGTRLWLTDCNRGREQQWYIVEDHDNRYAIIPARNSNAVVGTRGTGRDEYVVLAERWSSADRLWTFKNTTGRP